MGILDRFKSKSKGLETNSLQDQITGLSNQLDEALEENRELYYEKSIIDSNGSEPIAGSFGLVDEQYDKAMLQKLFMTETWFFIAVNTIAKTISSLPFKLEKRKVTKQNVVQASGAVDEIYKETWIEASAEPESQVFKFPNNMQTQMEFWYLIVADLLVTGDAYVHPLRDDTVVLNTSQERLRDAIQRVRHSDIKAIFRLNSAMVEVIMSEDPEKIIDGYAIISDEETMIFKEEDMIHIKMPNPSNPLHGLAPIVAVMKKVLLDRYTDEHHMRFYKQGARLGGVIETSKKLTKDQMSRLTKTFESNFTGKRQHHKTLILPEGMKYNIIEQSPVDNALIEFSKTNKEPILSAYNVPPIKVGLLDGATFANALIQNKTYYVDTIMPLTTLIEQAINKSGTLIKASRDIRFRFDFSQIEALQEDFKSKSESASGMLNSGMTVNEVREEVWGKPPIEGGEFTPAIRRAGPDLGALSLLNTTPTDQKVDAQNAQNDTEALSDIIPTEASFESRVAQLISEAITQGLDVGVATERAIIQALEEGFLPTPLMPREEEEEEKAIFHAPFSKEALTAYAKAVSGEGADHLMVERREEYVKFMKRLEKFIISKLSRKAYRKEKGFSIKITLPKKAELKKFIEDETDRVAKSLENAAKFGYKANIPSRSLTFPNERALKELKKTATEHVTSVSKTSLGHLKNILTASVTEQTSVTEVASRIEDVFGDLTRSKAETIARTETLSAISLGQNLKTEEFKEQFPDEAKEMRRVWITSQDSNVRDSHIPNDGEVRKVGDSFPNGLKFPREPGSPASEVINCRCSFVDFLPEDKDDIISILTGGSPLVG